MWLCIVLVLGVFFRCQHTLTKDSPDSPKATGCNLIAWLNDCIGAASRRLPTDILFGRGGIDKSAREHLFLLHACCDTHVDVQELQAAGYPLISASDARNKRVPRSAKAAVSPVPTSAETKTGAHDDHGKEAHIESVELVATS